MDNQNFTTTIMVDQSPAEVFDAVKNPKKWWSSDIAGNTENVDDKWTYHFGDSHRSTIRTVEVVPDKKIVWVVEDNYFKSVKDQSEWIGNKIVFEISRQGNKTRLVFTQIGLTPAYECYNACHFAWTGFVQQSLQSLITTGVAKLKWYEKV